MRCGSRCFTPTIKLTQEKLAELGYYRGLITSKMNEETQKAITQFQKDNNLKVGKLDARTLKLLDVEY